MSPQETGDTTDRPLEESEPEDVSDAKWQHFRNLDGGLPEVLPENQNTKKNRLRPPEHVGPPPASSTGLHTIQLFLTDVCFLPFDQ